jgi:predicted membrane protein
LGTRAVYGALLFALVMVLCAGAVIVYVNVQQSQAEDVVVRFVCADIEVARETATTEGLARATRLLAIIQDIGESCP